MQKKIPVQSHLPRMRIFSRSVRTDLTPPPIATSAVYFLHYSSIFKSFFVFLCSDSNDKHVQNIARAQAILILVKRTYMYVHR